MLASSERAARAVAQLEHDQQPMMNDRRFGRIFAWMELDFHVFVTLLFRSWSIVAGGITILLIPTCLTGVQQGYYYTFASILGLQIFFELGMGQVVVQIVAHEAARLRHEEGRGYQGDPQALGRLAAVGRLLSRWYLVAAALFLVGAGAAGVTFFRKGELSWPQWGMPWLLLVTATAANLWISWKMAFVEGFALVGQVSRLRLAQSMTGYALMWLTLLAGAGLWVVAVVPTVGFAMSYVWLHRSDVRTVYTPPPPATLPEGTFSWRREIFPFQWRIALSWMSGFFIFQLFTPVIFKYQGAVEAGRVGLGITIFNAVGMVGSSWVAAKVPQFGRLLSQNQRPQAINLFKRLLLATMVFVLLLSAALLAGVWFIERSGLRIAARLPSMAVFISLGAVQVANAFVIPAATFMRAHKEEPMLPSAVAMAVLTAASVYLLAPHGAAWAVGGYAALVWLVSLPWTVVLLRSYFRRK